jgi:hypothetical protein
VSRLGRLLKPETRDQQELRLHSTPERAWELCREVVGVLGWRSSEDHAGERRMTILEDPAHLNCGDSPMRLEVTVREGESAGSVAEIEGVVPGVGGVADKHLHTTMRAFALMLGRRDRAPAGA